MASTFLYLSNLGLCPPACTPSDMSIGKIVLVSLIDVVMVGALSCNK